MFSVKTCPSNLPPKEPVFGFSAGRVLGTFCKKSAAFFFFFFAHMQKFPGQGSDLHHSSDQSHNSDNAKPPGNSKNLLKKR